MGYLSIPQLAICMAALCRYQLSGYIDDGTFKSIMTNLYFVLKCEIDSLSDGFEE